jgi:hypothetical protein
MRYGQAPDVIAARRWSDLWRWCQWAGLEFAPQADA